MQQFWIICVHYAKFLRTWIFEIVLISIINSSRLQFSLYCILKPEVKDLKKNGKKAGDFSSGFSSSMYFFKKGDHAILVPIRFVIVSIFCQILKEILRGKDPSHANLVRSPGRMPSTSAMTARSISAWSVFRVGSIIPIRKLCLDLMLIRTVKYIAGFLPSYTALSVLSCAVIFATIVQTP